MPDDHEYTLKVNENMTEDRKRRSGNDHHTTMQKKDKFKLIGCVQKYPCLYDLLSFNYKDPQLRNNCWEKVSKEVGFSASACKSAWDILRNNYSRARRTLQSRPAGSASKQKIWAFYRPLSFLGGDEHVETTSNVGDDNAEQEVSLVHEVSPTPFILDGGESSSNGHDGPAEVSQNDCGPLIDHQIPRKKAKPSVNGGLTADRSASVRKIANKVPEDSFHVSASGESDVGKAAESSSETKSEATLFGQLVSAKLETMDFKTREIAMHKINEILFKGRMGLLKSTWD